MCIVLSLNIVDKCEAHLESRRWTFLLSVFMFLSFLSCGGGPQSSTTTPPPVSADCSSGTSLPARLAGSRRSIFRDLGGGKSLWIFGDTFVGPASATSRTQATGFLRNSIAISTCSGQTCTFQYYGRHGYGYSRGGFFLRLAVIGSGRWMDSSTTALSIWH